MKDKRYEEVLDDYNIAEPGLIEEIFPHLDPASGIQEEIDVEINESSDKKGNLDLELRLVNAYFKEVSSEQLLTPEQEIDISSNIKGFENKANR
ncbi:MAG: sigma-70 factor domain-containing protein, partial [Thermodesulfobacteriota bacterium]